MTRIPVWVAAVVLGSAATGPARAADLAAVEVVAAVPVPDDLWRGHFSGGRNLAPGSDPIALDWYDNTQFFASDRACRQWLREMRVYYSTYEGYHGCLRIR